MTREVSHSSDFTKNAMLRMLWMEWMEKQLMEEKSVLPWRNMVDPLINMIHVVTEEAEGDMVAEEAGVMEEVGQEVTRVTEIEEDIEIVGIVVEDHHEDVEVDLDHDLQEEDHLEVHLDRLVTTEEVHQNLVQDHQFDHAVKLLHDPVVNLPLVHEVKHLLDHEVKHLLDHEVKHLLDRVVKHL